MSAALLKIWVGPVQDFIAAARRTRDLWFGSRMLSDVSKAAALAVARHRATGGVERLIFPACPSEAPLLDPQHLIANIILAEIADGAEAAEVARAARQAAQARWEEHARQALDDRRIEHCIRMDLWREQVADFIEFAAAWVPFNGAGDYRNAREQLDRLHAGRKACRDFEPAKGRPLIPKSSLDGKRESVIPQPDDIPAAVVRRLRARKGEQLDAVGLTKRLGSGHQPFPSLTRVAADPWLRGTISLAQAKPDLKFRLDAFLKECGKLEDIVHPLREQDFPQYKDFPYEGSVVYESRLCELEEEQLPQDHHLDALRSKRNALIEAVVEPDPYVALLHADGDQMGKLISKIQDAKGHRAFSRLLSEFAQDVEGIVKGCYGTLIYSGGDDVLALLPTDRCVPCARQLHDEFGRKMGRAAIESGISQDVPTLSVGIAIGHFLEDLELFLNRARGAEQAAKAGTPPDHQDGRNSLAVWLHPRSGPPIQVQGRWGPDVGEAGPAAEPYLDTRLLGWASLFGSDAIPSTLPYDFRSIAPHYEKWAEEEGVQDRLKGAIQSHARLIVRKKQPGIVEKPQAWSEILSLLEGIADAGDLRRLADEMLVARRIGRAITQARPRVDEGRSEEE